MPKQLPKSLSFLAILCASLGLPGLSKVAEAIQYHLCLQRAFLPRASTCQQGKLALSVEQLQHLWTGSKCSCKHMMGSLLLQSGKASGKWPMKVQLEEESCLHSISKLMIRLFCSFPDSYKTIN